MSLTKSLQSLRTGAHAVTAIGLPSVDTLLRKRTRLDKCQALWNNRVIAKGDREKGEHNDTMAWS